MKNIQKLFKSLELSPENVASSLSETFNIPIFTETNHPVLEQLFKNKNYSPIIVSADFSRGKEKKTCLIGKGILYDSGGYNIKSDASDMHRDRFGSLTAFVVAKTLKLPVKVFLAVNLITSDSTLPGSIINYRTKNVRYVNVDGEGRMGLAACIEECDQYKNLITFATLTGHSVSSIGNGHAEIFSKNTKKLIKILSNSNKVLGIGRYFEDYKNGLIKENILENLNSNYREAGAAKAYAFLNYFITKNQELHHFDIAGMMNNQLKNYKYGLNEILKAIKSLRG